MASLRKVKCPYCSFTNTKEKVINHIELKHEDMIPQGFTAARVLFNFINKKDHGTCVICKGNTTWNEKTNKYNRLCNKPECKNKLREIYKKNMLKVYGKTTLLNDPEQQKKMLANRSISGVYKFSNGKIKEYTGSFEKKFLQFMDTMMGYDPDDIIMPGPTLEYEYNGEKHQWITDALIVPYNLIIEIKDGGDFKNNRSMVSYREKQVAKEEMITNMGKYNYLRLTNNQFGQLIDILYDLKMQMIDDSDENKKTIVKIHESLDELDMTNGQKVYKRYLKIHKRRLKDSFNSRIIPLKNALLLSEEECYELRERILKHDKSRMSDEEFDPLRKAKFPEDEQEKKEGNKEKDAAWKHHYALNDHHPEHWKGKEIPSIVIAEMIIDWETDCRHDGGNPLNWYLNTKEGIETQKKINPKTRLIIERVLKTIYNIDMNLKDNYDRDDDPVAVTESSTKIKLYHISEKDIDGNTLIPRIPSNYFTKNGFEDDTTPRVSFSTSIQGCLMGLSQNCKGKTYYVYSPETDIDSKNIYKPNIKEVPDSKITKEVWVLQPVKIKKVCKIYVKSDTGEDGIKFSYGNKTAELYKWDYEIIQESSQPIFISEDDLEIKLDDWKDGKIKCLFIAGMSGGGKSTLANNLAKEYDAIMIEMDLIMWFLKVGKAMPIEPPYKLIEWHKYKTHKPYPDDKEMERISTDKPFKKNMICDYLEWVIQKSPKQFVIEGPIDDIVKYRPNLLEDGALIVKGTSTLTSVIRRIKRDFTRTDRPMDGISIKYLAKVLFKDYPKYQKDMNSVRNYVDNYNESSQPLPISEKVKEYEEYIKEHIQNVRNSYNDRKSKIQLVLGLSEGDMQELENRIKNHDNSKWSNDEFDAYRRHFHSVSDKEKEDSEEDFKKALNHHYMVNDHHPEYWKNTDMPNIAIAELICDWEAMGRKFGGNPLEYFEKNKTKLKAKMNEYSYNTIYNALKNIYDIKMDLKESVNNEDFLNPRMLNFTFDKDIYINYDKPYKVYKCYPYAFYDYNLPRLKVDPMVMNQSKKLAIYGCIYLMTKGATGSNTFKPLEIKKSWWEKHKRDRVYWIESKKYHEYKGQLIVDGTNKNNYKAIVTTLDKLIHTEGSKIITINFY